MRQYCRTPSGHGVQASRSPCSDGAGFWIDFASGLTIYADTRLDRYTSHYATGPWAEGSWDDLVLLETEPWFSDLGAFYLASG